MTMREPPEGFWVQTEESISTDMLRVLYVELTARMQEEYADVPGFGTLEQLQLERVAYLYVMLRERESTGVGFENDRAYKEFLQLWAGLGATLQKARIESTDAKVLKADVAKTLLRIVLDIVAQEGEEVESRVRERLSEQLERTRF